MLDRFIAEEPLEKLSPVLAQEQVKELRRQCRQIRVHDDLRAYIVALAQGTRRTGPGGLNEGVSPRGTLALLRAAQGYAMTAGRDFVTPEDIGAVAVPVMAHRCISQDGTPLEREKEIRALLNRIPVPTENW